MIGSTVEIYGSKKLDTAKIEDADVVHGCKKDPVDDMESSVLRKDMSSSMVLGEEVIGSKAEKAEEPNRGGVGSGLAENSSALTLQGVAGSVVLQGRNLDGEGERGSLLSEDSGDDL